LEDPEDPVAVSSTVKAAPPAARVAGWTRALLASVPRGAGRSVSVLLCGDARMRALNRKWRGKDVATDVLSFPSGSANGFLGDVVIDMAYASRQAGERGHGAAREVQVLLAHGLLHLLGYDHETDDGEMFRLQARAVTKAFGPGPDGVPGEAAEPEENS